MSQPDFEGVVEYGSDGGVAAIRLYQGHFPEVVDAAITMLAASNSPVYVSSGRVVELIELTDHHQSEGVMRPYGAILLHEPNRTRMMELLGKAGRFKRYDGRSKDWVPTDCPRGVAEAILSRGDWPVLPELAGFCEAPFVTKYGRLVDRDGYDEETRIFVKISSSLHSMNIASSASLEDAIKAIDRLRQHLAEFAFVDQSDESAAISSLMTVLLVRLFESSPAIAISATAAGSGKTTLAEVASMIATGRRPAVLAIGSDDAEFEKRLAGAMLNGEVNLLLDNVERDVGGDLVCQTRSQPFATIRPMGTSSIVICRTNFAMFITGNSLSVKGDFKRRVVLIRMDAGLENPEIRCFKKDILKETERNRGRLIRDLLTITLAYLQAGEPTPDGWHPYGSFSSWDRMIRRPLMWAGLPDPLLASQALKDVDPEIEGKRMLFDAWDKAFPSGGGLQVSSIVSMAASGQAGAAELKEALNFICGEKITSKRVAGWLRRHRDRILDGRKVVLAGSEGHSKASFWRLDECL